MYLEESSCHRVPAFTGSLCLLFPHVSGIRLWLYLLRTSFHSAPGVDPGKLFSVDALARGSLGFGPALLRVRGVIAVGPVRISSPDFANVLACG